MKIFAFNYSETISKKFSEFGKNLRKNLKLSGLSKYISEEEYWNFVSQTWKESGRGERKSFQGELLHFLAKNIILKKTNQKHLKSAINRFFQNYFSSEIEIFWKKVFQEILSNPDAIILIATDNYQDATFHILKNLKKLGFFAESLGDEAQPNKNNKICRIFVANSGNLRYFKKEKEF